MSYTRYPGDVSSIPVPASQGGTGSTTVLNNNRMIVSSSGALVEASAITASRALVSSVDGIPVHATTTSTEMGYLNGVTSAIQTQFATKLTGVWTKYTTSHTAFQTAGLTNDITLFTLPAKTLIHKIILKQTTAFSGTLIATYTISIGITGNLVKYIAVYDVMAAVASNTFGVSSTSINPTLEDFSSGVAIKISAVSSVANLDASTAGSIDTYVLTSLLP